MKNLLAIGESIIVVAGITLVVKATLDITDKVKGSIKKVKEAAKAKRDGYTVVDAE